MPLYLERKLPALRPFSKSDKQPHNDQYTHHQTSEQNHFPECLKNHFSDMLQESHPYAPVYNAPKDMQAVSQTILCQVP